ncbi:MAG: hypothetical protein ACE5R4_17415 [Armatimonadota bacterium]
MLGQERPAKVIKGLAHNGLTGERRGKHGVIMWDPDDPTRRTTVSTHRTKLSRDEIKENLKQAGESQEHWAEKMQRL